MRLPAISYSACALVFGLALAAPASAYAYTHPSHVDRHGQHHATQAKVPLTNMTAFVAPTPANAVRETDGLSRNADDCNDGCIDH